MCAGFGHNTLFRFGFADPETQFAVLTIRRKSAHLRRSGQAGAFL